MSKNECWKFSKMLCMFYICLGVKQKMCQRDISYIITPKFYTTVHPSEDKYLSSILCIPVSLRTHCISLTHIVLAEQLVCPDGATHIAQIQASISFIDLFVCAFSLEVYCNSLKHKKRKWRISVWCFTVMSVFC